LKGVSFDDDTDKQQDVTFHRPFFVKVVDRWLPPVDYRVVTDEGLIEGLSFPAYPRVSTAIEARVKRGVD
jgi:hypothetical protein